jgi:hypothetical protein
MSLTLGAATKLLDNMMVTYSEWHTERAPQGKKVNSVEKTSSLSDKIDTIMLMLANDTAHVDSNNVPLASLVAQEEHVDVNFIRHEHIVVVCLGCGPATAAAHLHRQRKPWSMSTPPPTTPEAEKTANIPSWEMVEQVVGSGQGCALSTSHVRRCSLPVLAELQVHAACQWREVAAASATLAGTTALAGVTAEKGGEALNALASGIGQVFLGSLAGGPGVA